MLMTHVLAELYDCLPLIEDEASIAGALKSAAQSVGAGIVGEFGVHYIPHGLTVAVFLAESHMVLTTWPEHRLALLDVLLCNPAMDYDFVVAEIKERICPNGEMVIHRVPRKIAARP
jgi:S-adenosylmethionine decarboxylase